MVNTIKYPRIKKNCQICLNEFETLQGHKFEKTFCSRACSNESRKDKAPEKKKERLKEWAKNYRITHPEWTRACS